MKILAWVLALFTLASCGVVYTSPYVRKTDTAEAKIGNINIVELTADSVRQANLSHYTPRKLPKAYSSVSRFSTGKVDVSGIPDAILSPQPKPRQSKLSLPPNGSIKPYRIGVTDVLLLATPGSASGLEALPGLLAAQTSRQGYTVQDDGSISIPDVGRVQLAGLTLDEAEAEVFRILVSSQVDPTFSLEIVEFNSQRATIGGEIGNVGLIPITLKPLYLEEALAQAGGPTIAPEFSTIRIYREGGLYEIPLADLRSMKVLKKVRLQDEDLVYVDADYDLNKARAYFAEQIQLRDMRRSEQDLALSKMQRQLDIRQTQLDDARANFSAKLGLEAVERDYVFLVGELNQSRAALPFEIKTTLAQVLFEGGGVSSTVGDMAEIFVLRSSGKTLGAGVTAYHLDASNVVNLVLATQLELRPNDIIFVSEQPITKWNRSVEQLFPSLITQVVAAGAN
jgi:polysaccharide biosynthesis/export protein